MELKTLRLTDLRLFPSAELQTAPGLNLITGGNGAGKTSLLEAVYLLGYGRTFRGGARDGLVRQGATELQVFAQWTRSGGERRTGLSRTNGDWTARVDGVAVGTLTELHQACAVVCFEPGSHALLAGGSELRRRHLDWGLFHVEQEFLPTWRRYQRALKQRNGLLRQGRASSVMQEPWEQEMAVAGERIAQYRDHQLQAIEQRLQPLLTLFLPELGTASLRHRRGWNREKPLISALQDNRDRDVRLGYTVSGPHRGDWSLQFSELPESAPLSRGQEKLAALACVLAQAELLTDRGAETPLVLLDDLASELDLPHQERVWKRLKDAGVQVLATGTAVPESLPSEQIKRRFHVERLDGLGLVQVRD